MEKERREKNVNAHREGTLRAGARPHRRETSSHESSQNLTQIVTDFAHGLLGGTWNETYWGASLSKKEQAARKHFHVPDGEAIALILDTTILGSCKVGLALCNTGIYYRDERGERGHISWKELDKFKVDFDGSVLTIGDYRFLSKDGKDLSRLIQKLQEEL